MFAVTPWILLPLFVATAPADSAPFVNPRTDHAGPADSQQTDAAWGTLTGRIVVRGDVPKPELLDITRDEEVCAAEPMADESLLVDAPTGGLANVVLWIESRDEIPFHPSYETLAAKPVTLDNDLCRFVPRVLTLRTEQTLRLTNSDPVAHNAAAYARRNNPFSEIIPQSRPLDKSFSREEREPIRVDCSIHPWMKSWVLIRDTPYAAVTDQEGRFTIPHLPRGTWQLRIWHERNNRPDTLQHAGEPIELQRSAMIVTIDSPTTDLGILEFTAEQLTDD